jgi:hypothetical protein
MDQNLENLIRGRAYEIWMSGGCVHGQADQHWLAAEREILAASTAALAGKAAPQKSPVGCTFKDHQDARAGQLMPRVPEHHGPEAWPRKPNGGCPLCWPTQLRLRGRVRVAKVGQCAFSFLLH